MSDASWKAVWEQTICLRSMTKDTQFDRGAWGEWKCLAWRDGCGSSLPIPTECLLTRIKCPKVCLRGVTCLQVAMWDASCFPGAQAEMVQGIWKRFPLAPISTALTYCWPLGSLCSQSERKRPPAWMEGSRENRQELRTAQSIENTSIDQTLT